jgi:hypothetical protein
MNRHDGLDAWERRGRELIAAMWSKLTLGWSDYEDEDDIGPA